MWKTGHSHIKAKLAETGAKLAARWVATSFLKTVGLVLMMACMQARACWNFIATTRKQSWMFAGIPNSIIPRIKNRSEWRWKIYFDGKLIASAQFADAEMITIDGLRVNFADGWDCCDHQTRRLFSFCVLKQLRKRSSAKSKHCSVIGFYPLTRISVTLLAMTTLTSHDIVIVGGGMVGLSLALSLAQHTSFTVPCWMRKHTWQFCSGKIAYSCECNHARFDANFKSTRCLGRNC